MANAVKTWTLNNESRVGSTVELRSDGAPTLWISHAGLLSNSHELHIHTQSASGPVVAGAKLHTISNDVRIVLGNPSASGNWLEVTAGGVTQKEYRFPVSQGSRQFIWRRTHQGDLGARAVGANDFKLLDARDESKIIAAFINEPHVVQHDEGSLTWFDFQDPDTELLALAAVLGIQESISRRNQWAGNQGGGLGAGFTR